MTITQVSDYVYESASSWVIAVIMALIASGILAFVIFGPATNESGHTKTDVIIGTSFSVISFVPALFIAMGIIQMVTPTIYIYEGAVTSASEPTRFDQYPVVITTLEGMEEPMYIIDRGDTKELVKVSDEPQAFLCEPRLVGGKHGTMAALCDPMPDKPGSEEIEKLKAEGL